MNKVDVESFLGRQPLHVGIAYPSYFKWFRDNLVIFHYGDSIAYMDWREIELFVDGIRLSVIEGL